MNNSNISLEERLKKLRAEEAQVTALLEKQKGEAAKKTPEQEMKEMKERIDFLEKERFKAQISEYQSKQSSIVYATPEENAAYKLKCDRIREEEKQQSLARAMIPGFYGVYPGGVLVGTRGGVLVGTRSGVYPGGMFVGYSNSSMRACYPTT